MKDIGTAEEFDSQYFASQFHFDKKKFQEREGEIFVGFHDEANYLLKQLACITKKQLEVISIVGMAGLGKTTLAKRLYNDPYVVSYFYVRAWVTCSQVYQKRDLLLGILRSVVDIDDKKLGLCGPLTTKSGDLKCPDIDFLVHVKSLKLFNTIPLSKAGRLSNSIIFPGSLKRLTMSNTYLDWKEAWVFEMIPKLEVLKLKFHAFVGKDWETSPKAFPCLKFLKFYELDLLSWTASRYHFPVLQRLQVYRCPYLMKIPEDFGNICTLELIELSGCSDSASNSARDIQKEQESYGNDWLKILINPGLTLS
ncbi:hypothetical protein POM88_050476 [Heracleum sosnowskyi]|uniref:NB-ARC domain-containing protein n=1 Tax=Heracleum sosnowskyi TaxID=360622 RepID=A0AAD8H080_9APIA|nr:hypothetical protein POM88_050476 [Heracleum sosnowskyi]